MQCSPICSTAVLHYHRIYRPWEGHNMKDVGQVPYLAQEEGGIKQIPTYQASIF